MCIVEDFFTVLISMTKSLTGLWDRTDRTGPHSGHHKEKHDPSHATCTCFLLLTGPAYLGFTDCFSGA